MKETETTDLRSTGEPNKARLDSSKLILGPFFFSSEAAAYSINKLNKRVDSPSLIRFWFFLQLIY